MAGGALLALSVFLPWYGTDPNNRFARIDGVRGDSVVLGGPSDPALAAAGRLGGALHPRLHHRHRRQALVGARGDDDGHLDRGARPDLLQRRDRPPRRALGRHLAEVRVVPGPARGAADDRRRRPCAPPSTSAPASPRERSRSTHARRESDPPRPQPRARARARDRGRRARRGAHDRDGRQGGRRPGRGRRHARRPRDRAHGRHRRHRRGREGRGADALQRREHRRRQPARGRHRRRSARGHAARRAGQAQRAGRHRAEPARDDVRPRPVRLHGEDGRRQRRRRPALPRPPAGPDAGPRRRAPRLRHPRHHGRRPRPPAP